MRQIICKALFRTWPFSFGHVRLMEWLDPPFVDAQEVTTRLRRYPVRFSYDPNSYIGRFVHYRGLFEEQILRTIQRELRPGATFVDVGANVGVHTIVAAYLVGPRGRVISFEPGAKQRARLNRNVALNGLQNVEVHATALGRRPHSARLYSLSRRNDGQSSLASPGWSAPSEPVEVATLDSVLLDRPVPPECVIKIDVEGAEMDVLVGASGFIQRVKPRAIFVEIIESHLSRFATSSKELVRFLRGHGYELKGLVKGRWRAIDDDHVVDLDVIARHRYKR